MSARKADAGIVVGVDDSPTSKMAVAWAAREAELRNAPLILVHAISPDVATWLDVPLPAGLAQWQTDHGRRLIDDALEIVEQACRRGGPVGVRSELLTSAAVPALVDLSEQAELVVAGRRGNSGRPGRVLGSVSSGLIRHAHCPVAIIPDEHPPAPQPGQAPVLIGIDGSPASEVATAIAFDEASRRGVGLVALHAWSDVDVSECPGINWPVTQSVAEGVLAERLAGWSERYPDVDVRRVVVRDQPGRRLVEHSQGAQLLVVGSHGRGGFAEMLVGSVSDAVVRSACVPVIVARQPQA